MTDYERAQIIALQKAGYGYKKIATTLGLPVNGVKTFCRRNPLAAPEYPPGHCRKCGKPVDQLPGRKEKLYCSDACRMAWWKEHRSEMKKEAYYQLTCQWCGKSFRSYGFAQQKYCSRVCYGLSRRKEAHHE